MKKFLAILLAMMLVMVSVAAMADNPDILEKNGKKNAAVTPPVSVTITKAYNVKGVSSALTPAHQVKFTVDELKVDDSTSGKFPTGKLTVTPIDVAEGTTVDDESTTDENEAADMTINIPSYTEPGVYWYKINEVDPHIAGVTPSAATYLKVTVWNDAGTLKLGGVALRTTDNDGKTTAKDGTVTY